MSFTILQLRPASTLHAEPDTMQRLLERIRAEWGRFEGWAEHAGLPSDARQRLADRSLEPGSR